MLVPFTHMLPAQQCEHQSKQKTAKYYVIYQSYVHLFDCQVSMRICIVIWHHYSHTFKHFTPLLSAVCVFHCESPDRCVGEHRQGCYSVWWPDVLWSAAPVSFRNVKLCSWGLWIVHVLCIYTSRPTFPFDLMLNVLTNTFLNMDRSIWI